MSAPLFAIQGLAKGYAGRPVLTGVACEIARDECLVVLGRSGSGKSVLLRLLIGLERPDAGSIRFDGHEVVGLAERAYYPLRRRVAMLFQSGALFDSMNVFENVAFPLREHRRPGAAELAARVAELLARVGLEGTEEKMPSDLSGGMRKRVALARALALDPEALLYDEPTTGLDPMTAAAIARLIRATRDHRGGTAVVVTHDLALARAVADRVAFLDGGAFRFLGTLAEAERERDPLLADFLAGREHEDHD